MDMNFARQREPLLGTYDVLRGPDVWSLALVRFALGSRCL